MEAPEFDATLGGTEHLPFSANSLKFAASRSVEIAAMTESILRPSKTKLVFQSLPVHMRRRVMSHNSKRLPRKFRQAHLEQLKKSGLPPKQKRPSRKYRRRPANLLEEYNRRQKRNIWLETHIWHAKRFHMTERWGHRLAVAPCDKAFRACYRASSAHCLMQDISYFISIRIQGTIDRIRNLFSTITSASCGLSIVAKAYTTGNREGEIHLYESKSFPLNYIGKAQFLWEPSNKNYRTLWLFVHPSYSKQVESILTDLTMTEEREKNEEGSISKKRKIMHSEMIDIKILPNAFNRFRLTGPNSHAILTKSLKCIDDLQKIKSNEWVKQHIKCNSEFSLKEKNEYWMALYPISSPAQLPSRVIVGLVVRDPRLMRPTKRTKAVPDNSIVVNTQALVNIPPNASNSPLWNIDIHKTIRSKTMTNHQFIQHVTKMNLLPGEVNEEDPDLQSIPVVLVQRPGSQDSSYKRIGYGSGWDIIIPSGYSLSFWMTFVMFGARTGGLREMESLAFEQGECYLPPDSKAGVDNECRIEQELRDRYFKLPPSKRVNYTKLGINSPFICPWKLLLQDWNGVNINNFYVLRDWRCLDELQKCVNRKKPLPNVQDSHLCLVAVYLHLPVGSLRRYALICLPEHGDIDNIKHLFEPLHDDPNEKLRKIKKKEHVITLKRLKRHRIKLKKKMNKVNNIRKTAKKTSEPSEYVKEIRELWLPTNIVSVRKICFRQTMGYVSQGAFSFTEAHSCGIGYITYSALKELVNKGLNQVLVRNTSSRKYRLAKINIIKNV